MGPSNHIIRIAKQVTVPACLTNTDYSDYANYNDYLSSPILPDITTLPDIPTDTLLLQNGSRDSSNTRYITDNISDSMVANRSV